MIRSTEFQQNLLNKVNCRRVYSIKRFKNKTHALYWIYRWKVIKIIFKDSWSMNRIKNISTKLNSSRKLTEWKRNMKDILPSASREIFECWVYLGVFIIKVLISRSRVFSVNFLPMKYHTKITVLHLYTIHSLNDNTAYRYLIAKEHLLFFSPTKKMTIQSILIK